ncbi:hypothetical protein MKW94_028300 [Papaver nudicaule]|uniref:Uncharacterized protein n=1 Tax=Papaver nudicaule TaxID=74823 RepID=A0AA41SIK4_PAPNU|nr:hypothetical protein [Papaver nudicaule]
MNTEKLVPEENKVLADSIKLKLDKSMESSTTTTGCSIYRVHENLRRINRSAYMPEVISIGPFHHGEASLAAMEDHKLSYYVRALLSRATPGPNKLEECVACLKRIEDEARKCYSEPIELTSDEFVERMLIDGLFMIELLLRKSPKGNENDPILGNIWVLPSVLRDLVLLENQLPMVVLNCLFKVFAPRRGYTNDSIKIPALQFFEQFEQLMPWGKKGLRFSGCEGTHLLDLLGNACHESPEAGNKRKSSLESIPSVTELKRAGVKFSASNMSGSFMDVNFNNGILRITPVVIHEQTETLFRNIIANEQCCAGAGHVTYMTSYAILMSNLIKSAQDVRILREKGLLRHHLGDDKDVAALFSKLGSEVNVENFYFSELCDAVNSYYETHGCGATGFLSCFRN